MVSDSEEGYCDHRLLREAGLWNKDFPALGHSHFSILFYFLKKIVLSSYPKYTLRLILI